MLEILKNHIFIHDHWNGGQQQEKWRERFGLKCGLYKKNDQHLKIGTQKYKS